MGYENNIESFLEYLLKLKKENPSLVIDKNLAYANLIADSNEDISRFFGEWKRIFSDTSNISVWEDSSNLGFLNFTNNWQSLSGKETIKMYFSYDTKHIVMSAIYIFKYLAKENIVHSSKISCSLRNDSIVVRVGSEEDARKLADFVNNESYAHQGVTSRPCTTFPDKNISYSSDFKKSYNEECSQVISEYITSLNLTENPDLKTSKLDFKNFILNKIKNQNITNLFDDVNILEIWSFFIKTLDSNFTLENFYEHFNLISSKGKSEEEVLSYYNDILKSLGIEETKKITKIAVNEESDLEVKLSKILLTNITRGGINRAGYALYRYVSSKDTSYFTRTKSSRYEISLIDQEDLKNDLYFYCPEEQDMQIITQTLALNIYKRAADIIKKAIYRTSKEYDFDYTFNALVKLREENDSSNFIGEDELVEGLNEMNIDEYLLTGILNHMISDFKISQVDDLLKAIVVEIIKEQEQLDINQRN